MSETIPTIRVAILGGGFTGTAMLRSLLHCSHIVADLYESPLSPREEGLSIELSDTAHAILRAIDPSLDTELERAGVTYSTPEFRIAVGPHSGQRIDLGGSPNHGMRTVGRQAFLNEILAAVPRGVVRSSAQLSSIMETSTSGDNLILTFEDGTQKEYDVVIGADDIHGKTRAHVIGPDDPALKPRASGFWSLPLQVSAERAQQAMGTEFLDPHNARQVVWIGDGTLMQHGLLNRGEDVQIVAAAKFDNTDEEFAWAKIFTPEEFGEMFSQSATQSCQDVVKVNEPQYFLSLGLH
jgi:salicylate hydroxylase